MGTKGINQAGYAAHAGVSRKTVTEWKRHGLLVFVADGLVDVAASDAKRAGHGSKARRAVTGNRPVVTSKPKETPEEAAERIARSEPFATKADAEKVKETYLALLRKLEFDEKSAEVVKIADVAKVVSDEYSRVRSRLSSIPAEVAPRVAAMKSAEEVRDFIEAEVNEALRELSADDGRAFT